jgi:hypothetical protein
MNNIIQFECFETELNFDDFITSWEYYAKKLLVNNIEVTLHECFGGGNKYRYISKHEWPEDNFDFKFIKGKNSDFFNDHNVKLVQAGGYIPLQVECKKDGNNVYKKIMLFLTPQQANIQEFKELSFYHYLNIYESYFESSLYEYILEFFVDEQMSAALLQWLKANKYIQNVGVYRECVLLHE